MQVTCYLCRGRVPLPHWTAGHHRAKCAEYHRPLLRGLPGLQAAVRCARCRGRSSPTTLCRTYLLCIVQASCLARRPRPSLLLLQLPLPRYWQDKVKRAKQVRY